MQQIINFIIRNKTSLLFLLLFGVSIGLTIQSHSYHKSKFINSANFLTGGIYESASGISDYFNLRSQNDILIEENNLLRSQLLNRNDSTNLNTAHIDTISFNGNYRVQSARVINNNYAASKNYITLNKGQNDSIKEDLAVITSKGIVGIVDNTSNGYSRVLSILNTRSSINAQLKSTNHIGSLEWDAKSSEMVQLTDISKFAPVKEGDTIVTGGQSSIFPQGISIGTIDSYVLDISGDTYTVQVKLFNDMTNLGHVYIIENLDKAEIQRIERTDDE
ncbi:rod shape-determining protein MreC [Psychroserpens sp.]|uniref:rod shape-determining protein MreC n=1 Tax=Psychroserpens sp. TaxID=2020870 RepID=UPI001B018005|nr:rod shape-determining protein MreC [Psychroserpens sp.]MBO6605970.1 rod shape-determining protein MreC [Psychroserpens sp.]MBO6630894.1 rod shape-determining protein MreC [Psychroserpens sp.]MBO6652659.1 rod shape-determining protein MreC [Psychroserpens sp.]MBO6681569.1 rod shape-determining protein MreC [Psychroserpens sp.]MBO6749344.1 rod shape-determining protein MreC [Psychroserpens sp.]